MYNRQGTDRLRLRAKRVRAGLPETAAPRGWGGRGRDRRWRALASERAGGRTGRARRGLRGWGGVRNRAGSFVIRLLSFGGGGEGSDSRAIRAGREAVGPNGKAQPQRRVGEIATLNKLANKAKKA
jgi:hypothetical protein